VRSDLYAIHDELEFIGDHLARQPTRMDRRAQPAFPGFVTPISLVTRRPARDCFAALAMTAPV
jgi:hypothetical protein